MSFEQNYSFLEKEKKQSFKKYFKINKNKENSDFVNNKYNPKNCSKSDITCFDISTGAIQCSTSTNKKYDTQGKYNSK